LAGCVILSRNPQRIFDPTMRVIGYARLIEDLQWPVRMPERLAMVASSVNRRVETANRILFPTGVAFEDNPLGHLEFALRHEGIPLEIIDAVFERLSPAALIGRLQAAPNGESIRRACFLGEWLSGRPLEPGVRPTGRHLQQRTERPRHGFTHHRPNYQSLPTLRTTDHSGCHAILHP
jgi:hypothetical protein